MTFDHRQLCLTHTSTLTIHHMLIHPLLGVLTTQVPLSYLINFFGGEERYHLWAGHDNLRWKAIFWSVLFGLYQLQKNSPSKGFSH